jgi:hypothetical protein
MMMMMMMMLGAERIRRCSDRPLDGDERGDRRVYVVVVDGARFLLIEATNN